MTSQTNWHKTAKFRKNKFDTLLSSQKTPAHHQSLSHDIRGIYPQGARRNQKLHQHLQEAASGPGDRPPEGPFCPAFLLTERKLHGGRWRVKSAPRTCSDLRFHGHFGPSG